VSPKDLPKISETVLDFVVELYRTWSGKYLGNRIRMHEFP